MKVNLSNYKSIGLFGLFLLGLGGCLLDKENEQVSHQELSLALQDQSLQSATRGRGPTRESCIRVDFEAWYQSGLKKYGINDFRTESLISLMEHEIPSVRFYSALLLGERKEVSAIPKLEKALSDELFHVREAATKALLKMDNRKGIAVMVEFCENASAEFDEGNYQNTVHLSDAAKVLAGAGEISAIPYLKKLLTWDVDDSWGVRITALRSISKLYAKDPSVVTDISSMLNDKHTQIRAEAAEILQSLEASQ